MPEHSKSASYQAVSVSQTAQAPSIMIMFCGVNKALWDPLLASNAMYPGDTKSNLPTCEIHISPRGKRREERKQAFRDRIGFCLTERSTLAH